MAKWYYLVDGQETGPIEPVELKRLADAGRLKPHDKVRRQDMADWYQAKQVKGLFIPVSQAAASPSAATMTPAAAARSSDSKRNDTSSAVTATVTSKIVATEPPSPTPNITFGSWYATNLGHKPVLLQFFLWFFYGFIWIPGWWLVSQSSQVVIEPSSQGSESANKPVFMGVSQAKSKWLKRAAIVFVCGFLFLVAIGTVINMVDPKKEKGGALSSFDEIPPPIAVAVTNGKEVWVLNDHNWVFKADHVVRKLRYLVIDKNQLARNVLKYEFTEKGAQ